MNISLRIAILKKLLAALTALYLMLAPQQKLGGTLKEVPKYIPIGTEYIKRDDNGKETALTESEYQGIKLGIGETAYSRNILATNTPLDNQFYTDGANDASTSVMVQIKYPSTPQERITKSQAGL